MTLALGRATAGSDLESLEEGLPEDMLFCAGLMGFDEYHCFRPQSVGVTTFINLAR